MSRITAALFGLLSILFAGCSTIVKGTDQQVSVNTPGVNGAMCQLQSPAVGTRTVQTPANIVLPKSKHNVAVTCQAQCYAKGVGTLAFHTSRRRGGYDAAARLRQARTWPWRSHGEPITAQRRVMRRSRSHLK